MSLRRILRVTAIGAGALLGIGGVTFHYADGTSYLSTDPAACANCHIMQSQYDSWQKSSHHTVATCVDCHMPEGFVAKYLAKAENGWKHSKAFTLQDFPEPIRITPKNAAILQASCLRCHSELVHGLSPSTDDAPSCVHCHRDVGHGPQVGLGGPPSIRELRIEDR